MIKKITFFLTIVFSHPYNKQYPLFAAYRIFKWHVQKIIFGKNPIPQIYWNSVRIFSWKNSLQSKWLNYNYYMDWKEFHLIARYCKPGNIIFDVGSNIGIYSLWMSTVADNSVTIYAFEPHPETFLRLNKQVEYNKLSNIITKQVALSDLNGNISFSNDRDDQNYIIPENHEIYSIQVKSQTLDNFCELNNISQIDFLKIDVEGAELLVFKGAIKMLQEHKINIIQFELNNEIDKFKFSKNDILQLLTKFGYSIYDYDIVENVFLSLLSLDNTQQNIYAIYDLAMVQNSLTNINITKLKRLAIYS